MNIYYQTKIKVITLFKFLQDILIKNLEFIDNIKITDHEIISGGIKINDYLGESGVAIEKYLFGDNRIALISIEKQNLYIDFLSILLKNNSYLFSN